MFNPTNFMEYGLSGKAIRIRDNKGKVTNTINICKYQKSGVVDNFLIIVLADNIKEYKMDFADSQQARIAFDKFRYALNLLVINCDQGSGPGPTPTSNEKTISINTPTSPYTWTNSQQSFQVPTGITVTKATEIEMFVNGQKLIYGKDFIYISGLLQILTYDNGTPNNPFDDVPFFDITPDDYIEVIFK